MEDQFDEFNSLLHHPVKFRLFLLKNLPSAYFSGVRIKSFTRQDAIVTVRYKWFTKNPFRSTYFACLAMAAEMSTGLLAMSNIYKRKPAISMLVTAMEVEYFKKATGITSFTCNDGLLFKQQIDAAAAGEPQTCKATSVGINDAGELIARFTITWSFKARK